MAVALLTIIGSTSLPLVEADTQNSSQNEEICQWDDQEGKEKCKQHQQIQAEIVEQVEEEDYEYDDDVGDDDFGYDDLEDFSETDMELFYYKKYYRQFMSLPTEGEEFDVWKHGTKNQLYYELNCPEEMKDSTFESIHTTETWELFNKIYNEVIAATQGDKELQQASTIPEKFEKSGFQFPVEVKFDDKKGRGIYSKVDIPKGSLLYISTNNGAFLNGQTYRNFLKALPRNLACDVMIWAFVRWVSLESEYNDAHMVCVDLDEGSFINAADSSKLYNMALGNDAGKLLDDMDEEEELELWYGCKMKFYAYKDIKAGEEIQASYADFAEQSGWRFLGLGLG